MKRYYRFGQTHGFLLWENMRQRPLKRIHDIMKALSKSLFCFLVAPFHINKTDRMAYWLLRGTMHAGVVARLLGQQELKQYGLNG
jgi:succinoglycan biosynthesis protein ExoM